MNLHGWYKPKFAFHIDGTPWTTDGRIAVAVDALPDSIDMHPSAHRVMGDEIAAAKIDASARTSSGRGHAIFGEHVFQAHYIDLCEAAHTGIEWRWCGSPSAPIVGFVDDRAVAVVMGMRVDGQDSAAWPEVYPECTTCDGCGGPECERCYGSGESECSHCGNETECEACDGEGHTKGCPDCGGTGRWTPPAEPASAANA